MIFCKRRVTFLPGWKDNHSFRPEPRPAFVKPGTESFHIAILACIMIGTELAMEIDRLIGSAIPFLAHDESTRERSRAKRTVRASCQKTKGEEEKAIFGALLCPALPGFTPPDLGTVHANLPLHCRFRNGTLLETRRLPLLI